MTDHSDPEIAKFFASVQLNIEGMKADSDMRALSLQWLRAISRHRYAYNFTWMGRPLIQFPQDMVAMQEIIWATQPDLIIETGVAHGGSLVYYASLLELVGGNGRVVGVDIDIRSHNRRAIEASPMFHRIDLVEGSSVDLATVERVQSFVEGRERVMVVLDSNHTHDHVLEELRLYSPLVTAGNYLVVFDTLIEDMPDEFFHDRPWGVGNNPKTAVTAFLQENRRFVVDADIEAKLMLTVAPGGYLQCVG